MATKKPGPFKDEKKTLLLRLDPPQKRHWQRISDNTSPHARASPAKPTDRFGEVHGRATNRLGYFFRLSFDFPRFCPCFLRERINFAPMNPPSAITPAPNPA